MWSTTNRRTLVAVTVTALLFLFAAWAGATAGVLRLGMQYDHGTLDPQLITSVGDKQMAVNMYDGLVQYKLGGTDIEPDLATDWTVNDAGTEWTFNLRQNVQFQKGYGEVTADDVVFTFDRLLDPALKSPNANLMKAIASTEAAGPYQVLFHLSDPDPAFLDKLAQSFSFIVSRKAVEEKGETFGDDPIGTGQYQFDSWSPQQQTVLKPFADAWRGTPGLQEVDYVPIPDATTMYNAFEAGDVDLIQVTDPDKLAKYQSNADIQVQAVPGLITRFVGFNTDVAPFDDPKVREAINYAINRDDMLQYVFKGVSTAADSILAPGVQHVARHVIDYTYDPEHAKQLLADAGYGNGLKVEFTVPNIDRFTVPATVIQENLQAVGITVDIKVMEVQAFLAALRSADGLQMFSLSRGQDATPDRVLYSWFHSSQIPENNWARVRDPEVDQWLDAAVSTMDESKRDELFRKVQEKIAAGNYYYYIDHENMIFALQSGVKGFVADPQRSLRLDGVTVE